MKNGIVWQSLLSTGDVVKLTFALPQDPTELREILNAIPRRDYREINGNLNAAPGVDEGAIAPTCLRIGGHPGDCSLRLADINKSEQEATEALKWLDLLESRPPEVVQFRYRNDSPSAQSVWPEGPDYIFKLIERYYIFGSYSGRVGLFTVGGGELYRCLLILEHSWSPKDVSETSYPPAIVIENPGGLKLHDSLTAICRAGLEELHVSPPMGVSGQQ